MIAKPKSDIAIGSLWATVIIIALTALTGLLLLLYPLGNGLTLLSYDLPYGLRPDRAPTNIAIVYLDDASHRELQQPMNAPWDRSLHARLIDQLTAQGAKVIVFDILFTDASVNTNADKQLADAIKRSGRVILGGNYQKGEPTAFAKGQWEELPYKPFRDVAVAWGNVNLTIDPDYGIRYFFPTVENPSGEGPIPWLAATAARAAGAPASATDFGPGDSRWLNYYGPPGAIPNISYFQAIEPDGASTNFFKGKIVFVGGQLSADYSGKGKDEYRTPYSLWENGFSPGVEIHATATGNILSGNWMRRIPQGLEFALILLIAVGISIGLVRLQPFAAMLVALLAALLITLVTYIFAWYLLLWFAWLIVICELAVALLGAVTYNSIRLFVERKLLEQSLAVHLSPALVKRVLSDPDLRRRGGVNKEVSLLFTDLENFSRLGETMNPDDLVNLLNRYFEAALQCIHETDGTVMGLMGDAIFAIWNAPIEQPDHRERACRAATLLQERLNRFEDAQYGFPLRTRVGLHTGLVCVGNIGSEKRFDYTAIGEHINLGSRLEGLNKHFATGVLATREVQHVMEAKLTSRLIGHIQVKGFAKAVEIYEFLGSVERMPATAAWRAEFAAGLVHFRQQNFDAAEQSFRQTIALRRQAEGVASEAAASSQEDGPSLFYLKKIAELRVTPPPSDWLGEVVMVEK